MPISLNPLTQQIHFTAPGHYGVSSTPLGGVYLMPYLSPCTSTSYISKLAQFLVFPGLATLLLRTNMRIAVFAFILLHSSKTDIIQRKADMLECFLVLLPTAPSFHVLSYCSTVLPGSCRFFQTCQIPVHSVFHLCFSWLVLPQKFLCTPPYWRSYCCLWVGLFV